MSENKRFKHSPQTDARILQGYEANEPVSEIAAAIGVSKNTVIGRANRIGAKYDLSVKARRVGDKIRGQERPKQKAYWASIPREVRQAHMARARAGKRQFTHTQEA